MCTKFSEIKQGQGQGQILHKTIIIGIEGESGIYHKERKNNNQNKMNGN